MSTKTASHKASFYVWIWVALLVLLGISIPLSSEGWGSLGVYLIFGIAMVKALLVLVYYMGLKYEPAYITIFMLIGVLFMGVLFLGLIPDMVYVYGKILP